MSEHNTILPREKPFRFTDLPRELRDNIYDLLPRGRRTIYESTAISGGKRQQYALRMSLGDRPLSRFMLINKQVGGEYSQRAAKNGHLLIEDLRCSMIHNTELPATALDARHITFKLASCPPNHHEDVRDQINFAKDVLQQMRKKPSFCMELYFDTSSQDEKWSARKLLIKYQAQFREVQEIAGFERLELFLYVEKEPVALGMRVEELAGTLLAKLTTEEGWQIW